MSVDNLSSVPMFIDLDDEELAGVQESCTPRKYPKKLRKKYFGLIVKNKIKKILKSNTINRLRNLINYKPTIS